MTAIVDIERLSKPAKIEFLTTVTSMRNFGLDGGEVCLAGGMAVGGEGDGGDVGGFLTVVVGVVGL